MNILIIGSGGREHALTWKIAQSKLAKKIFCAPGNGGMTELATCVDIKADDIEGLLKFAKDGKIDLTVVGPEAPLALGITDVFRDAGLLIFGPTKAASRLESSKIFAKQLMKKYNVPTSDFEVFNDAKSAKDYISKKKFPLVIKADGLAQGKGVVISATQEDAMKAIELAMEKKAFGDAGNRVIIEDCLEGEEASIIVFTDGKTIVPLASSQDHKRVFDNDKGANTGGMGAYSPAPVVTDELFQEIDEKIIKPVISGMEKEGCHFQGILYVGIMVTPDGPRVLEFNVRFGDPETQTILPRLKSDLLEVILKCAQKKLANVRLKWMPCPCVCVVAASGGYPGKYEKGKLIQGLDQVKKMKEVVVFHAGTKKRKEDAKTITSGGRVLGVSSIGDNISTAIDRAYQALEIVRFEGMHFRRDIGFRALKRES